MNNIIQQFNNISIDFLTQMAVHMGSSYLYKYKLMTSFNCMYAIDMFIENVLLYKHRIINKEESFFINKSVDSNYVECNYIDDIIGIKSIYHTLDIISKENIWNILTALVYLAEERYKLLNNYNISS